LERTLRPAASDASLLIQRAADGEDALLDVLDRESTDEAETS